MKKLQYRLVGSSRHPGTGNLRGAPFQQCCTRTDPVAIQWRLRMTHWKMLPFKCSIAGTSPAKKYGNPPSPPNTAVQEFVRATAARAWRHYFAGARVRTSYMHPRWWYTFCLLLRRRKVPQQRSELAPGSDCLPRFDGAHLPQPLSSWRAVCAPQYSGRIDSPPTTSSRCNSSVRMWYVC